MKRKKLLSYFLSILLVTLMPVSILAENYYMEDGNITITNDGTQKVTQGSVTNNDDAPVITQRDSNTAVVDKKITVETTDDNVAKFTIQNINIKPSTGDGIDVGSSNAEINLKGNNTIDASNDNADSAIHVSSGTLTITSTDNGTLTLDVSGSMLQIL